MKSANGRTSRRMFLRGLGAATAIPFLPSLASTAEAQSHSYDRVLFVVWEHGVDPKSWQPTVPGFRSVGERIRTADLRDATMGLYMGSEFAGLEHKMSIVRGVSMVGAWGHTLSVLTGGERGPDRDYRLTSTSPISIDNVLGENMYDTPPAVDVLRLSKIGPNETHSYRDGMWIPAVNTESAFAQLFGGGFPDATTPIPSGPSAEEQAARRRLSVARRSLAQYRRLLSQGRLSAADARQLEGTIAQYATLSSTLEARVAAFEGGGMPVVGDSCSPFTVSGSSDSNAMKREHIQLFAQAFACGASRVGYWKLHSSHADTDGIHQASSSANRSGSGICTQVLRTNVQHIAELMRAFDSILEGNGKTLLDNTLIVGCSDLASSLNEHNGVDAPFLLAGGLGGKFRMGEFIDFADYEHGVGGGHNFDLYCGPPHNELLISIMKGCGLDAAAWGGGGFGDFQCTDRTCGPDSRTQGVLKRYYENVHRSRRAPGAELPYLRV